MVGAPRPDVCWDLTYKPGAVRTSKPDCEACLCGLARYLTDRTRQLEIAELYEIGDTARAERYFK